MEVAPNAASSTTKTKGIGMSVEAANFLSFWGNWILLGALVVGALATGVVIVSGVVKDRAFEIYKLGVAAQVADAATAGIAAGKAAGNAILEAGKANERAASLEKEAADTRERAEKLEKENLQLRKDFSPRRITPEQHKALVAALSKLHGTINIESMSDPESGTYAGDILKTFLDAGWKKGETSFPLGEIWEGLIFEDTNDPTTVAVLKAFLDAGIADCHAAQRGKPSVTILVGGKLRSF